MKTSVRRIPDIPESDIKPGQCYFRLSIGGVVVHPFINNPSDWLRGFKAARDFIFATC